MTLCGFNLENSLRKMYCFKVLWFLVLVSTFKAKVIRLLDEARV
jgi:hypothetical protein